jgi:glucosyl-dolichyl phosphate glucuronosyltransferase
MTPDVSVVIPCHTERRWTQLCAAIDSALSQQPAPVEIVVAVDHNETLFARASAELPHVTVVRNAYQRGVSGNRNSGVQHTRTPLVALLDDDAFAHPGWLAGLTEPFEDPAVVGTGGAIAPAWESHRPAWFPDEFLWAVGGAYTGLPTTRAQVRNVWSASMAVRRETFDAVGGFRVGFGKVGDRARPEDTDLCLRMSDVAGGQWIYVPDAVIDHPVPADRSTFRFFVHRCYQEGRGKVELARLNRGGESLGSERDYLTRTLPRAVVRGFGDTLRRRQAAGIARSAAVVAGFGAAGFGGAIETLRRRPEPQPQPALAVDTQVPAADVPAVTVVLPAPRQAASPDAESVTG